MAELKNRKHTPQAVLNLLWAIDWCDEKIQNLKEYEIMLSDMGANKLEIYKEIKQYLQSLKSESGDLIGNSELVGVEFKDGVIQAKSVWIKASERNPPNWFTAKLRNIEQDKEINLPVKAIFKTLIEFETDSATYQSYTYINNIEWLDESDYYISNSYQDRLIQKQKDEIRELTFKLAEALQENEENEKNEKRNS